MIPLLRLLSSRAEERTIQSPAQHSGTVNLITERTEANSPTPTTHKNAKLA
jgi:hypothetical protein